MYIIPSYRTTTAIWRRKSATSALAEHHAANAGRARAGHRPSRDNEFPHDFDRLMSPLRRERQNSRHNYRDRNSMRTNTMRHAHPPHGGIMSRKIVFRDINSRATTRQLSASFVVMRRSSLPTSLATNFGVAQSLPSWRPMRLSFLRRSSCGRIALPRAVPRTASPGTRKSLSLRRLHRFTQPVVGRSRQQYNGSRGSPPASASWSQDALVRANPARFAAAGQPSWHAAAPASLNQYRTSLCKE
jgi:hypothetical protein